MDLRTTLAAVAVTIGCVVAVTVRLAMVPTPTPLRLATPAERDEIAQAIAASESTWMNETAQNFPQDRWSQRDDFHGREYHKVKELSGEKGIRIEEVLRAVDDDIHRRKAKNAEYPDDRNAVAVPCKPRPFYD